MKTTAGDRNPSLDRRAADGVVVLLWQDGGTANTLASKLSTFSKSPNSRMLTYEGWLKSSGPSNRTGSAMGESATSHEFVMAIVFITWNKSEKVYADKAHCDSNSSRTHAPNKQATVRQHTYTHSGGHTTAWTTSALNARACVEPTNDERT